MGNDSIFLLVSLVIFFHLSFSHGQNSQICLVFYGVDPSDKVDDVSYNTDDPSYQNKRYKLDTSPNNDSCKRDRKRKKLEFTKKKKNNKKNSLFCSFILSIRF